MRKIILKDCTQWPDPSGTGLEHALRYGESLSRSELLQAASAVSAYRHLLHGDKYMPETLREIRKELRLGQ